MDIKPGFSLEALTIGKSPLLDTWPLYADPIPIAIILFAYVYFVLRAGPRFMKSRQPYKLKLVIIVYNALQVYYNYWVLKQSIVEPIFWKYLFSFGCAQITPSEQQFYEILICRGFWNMTMNKVIDLLDTVFFVLCKKENNITFLHVQHHVFSVAILWICGKYFTGQEFTATFFCNTTVHVVMYFYYFLAALGPQYRKYLWWKKYLTLMQIIQFVIIIFYMVASIWLSCGYNQKIIWLLIVNVSLNLILFLNFFFRTYDSKQLIRDKVTICGSLQFNNNYTQEETDSNSKKSL